MTAVNSDPLMVSGQAVGLRAVVTDRIRLAIVTGHFRPGRQLRERELCEMTGVSRPSLREALRQLEAEGLITSIPHRGPTVTSLTVEEVGQLYFLRLKLESCASREFAKRRDPEHVRALKAATAQLAKLEGKGTPVQLLDAGTALYQAIAAGSGNPYLMQALERLHNRIKLVRFIALHDDRTTARSLRYLRELSAAVIAGDEKAAQRICAEHLEGVTQIAENIVAAGYQLPEQAVAEAPAM